MALNLPSVLAYERSIQPSIGLMYSLLKDGSEKPITVQEEKLRGVISDYPSSQNLEKNIGNPNLQTIDVARLDPHSNTLIVKFNVVFLNQSQAPIIHNSKDDFDVKLRDFARAFKSVNGYNALAKLYLTQIKNGRWLWRNSHIANDIEITFSPKISDSEIIGKIAEALSGDKPFMIDVIAKVTTGYGQEVFPSQEFAENNSKSSDGKNDKSKVLAKFENKYGYLHSQKIGNAIRTIDEWYNENAGGRPIAIEPFGVNQALQKAFRPSKNDLYTYMKNLDKYIKELESGELSNDSKFIMACLIRGGVFGGTSTKKETKGKKDTSGDSEHINTNN